MYFQLSFFFFFPPLLLVIKLMVLLLGLSKFTYNFSAYGENCIGETTSMHACMHARKGMNSRI
jgi:hypothetical protein